MHNKRVVTLALLQNQIFIVNSIEDLTPQSVLELDFIEFSEVEAPVGITMSSEFNQQNSLPNQNIIRSQPNQPPILTQYTGSGGVSN